MRSGAVGLGAIEGRTPCGSARGLPTEAGLPFGAKPGTFTGGDTGLDEDLGGGRDGFGGIGVG